MQKNALTAGVDEAGRGPLIGSVFAAAVILPKHYDLPKLTDSKKLNESQRDTLNIAIREQAIAYAVASASAEEIEELNILQATLLAMKRAILLLNPTPESVLIDGNQKPKGLALPIETIIKGDATVAAISAASILAKTARDAEMHALHRRHPDYGFSQHKGYGTQQHLAAIKKWGILPEHRRQFKPIRLWLEEHGLS